MEVMRAIDERYKQATGLSSRPYYKIFYSHIHEFPLLVLGQNPGGETDGTDLVASEGYFENWEHDYVCFRHNSRYALALPICQLLASALNTDSTESLRQVPATNVIFRRSRNTNSLNLSPTKAAAEAEPFLSEIVGLVGPAAVLLISKMAYDLFTKFHCLPGSVVEETESRILTPNGRSNACIYQSAVGFVTTLGRATPLLMVGHPSKYSSRIEWPSVMEALSRALKDLGISPIESTGVRKKIPEAAGYGPAI